MRTEALKGKFGEKVLDSLFLKNSVTKAYFDGLNNNEFKSKLIRVVSGLWGTVKVQK